MLYQWWVSRQESVQVPQLYMKSLVDSNPKIVVNYGKLLF